MDSDTRDAVTTQVHDIAAPDASAGQLDTLMGDPANWQYIFGTACMCIVDFYQRGQGTLVIPQRLHCPASSIESSSDTDPEPDSSLSSGDLVPLITFSENDMAGINLHGVLHEDLKPEPQFALSDITSPFKLHVEWPGCESYSETIECEQLALSHGVIDLLPLTRSMAQQIETLLKNPPPVDDPKSYRLWNFSDYKLQDMYLLWLRNVSSDGWQPVIGVKQCHTKL
ncbi:hypothetical protein BC629DRAFT_199334 [Irpex lacteus]|nr:hypothetical protein BC629DRAFT_199334 [Irpex lacteus]